MGKRQGLFVAVGDGMPDIKNNLVTLATFEHVNVTRNILENIHTTNEVRFIFRTLYGPNICRFADPSNASNSQIMGALCEEIKLDSDKHVIDKSKTKVYDRKTGRQIAALYLDKYLKVDKNGDWQFKKLNFRTFFYTIADVCFNTRDRYDVARMKSDIDGRDHNLYIKMYALKGSTEVAK